MRIERSLFFYSCIIIVILLGAVNSQNCEGKNCDILSSCPQNSTCLNGVNLPALIYQSGDYVWKKQSPTEGDVSLYRKYGFNTVRYGFLWELLQPDLSSGWNMEYFNTMVSNVTAIVESGMTVILDCHNFAKYRGKKIGQDPTAPSAETFAEMWATVAKNFTSPQVMFGLINEPEGDYDAGILQQTLQTVVNALRTNIPSNQYILLPSNHWQGMSTWLSTSDFTLAINDTTGKTLIDIHSYFDGNGGKGNCTNFKNNWSTYYTQVTEKLRKNKRKAFLSEIGGRAYPDCVEAINDALCFLDKNSDVWVGYTAWGPEQAQPQKFQVEENDFTSLTALFIDCSDGDLVNKAFVHHGIMKPTYNGSCCLPGKDSIASIPKNTSLQCNSTSNSQCSASEVIRTNPYLNLVFVVFLFALPFLLFSYT